MITNIRLQNFRSYVDSSFEFSDGVNIVVGPNATGKTNLIEAIHVVARNSSFRVKDNDLVMFGKDWTRIDSYISETDRTVKIEIKNNKLYKTTLINGKEYKRLPKQQYFPVVLFEPTQLNILSGSPEGRRNLIDELIYQANPEHLIDITKYKRILLQRNMLLKSGRTDPDQLFVWNTRLVEVAWRIVDRRIKIIKDINNSISYIYSDVAGKDHEVEIEYKTSCDQLNYVNTLFRNLEDSIDKDLARGFTGYGPHRDDIKVYINQNDTGVSASRGEARTMLLALKHYEITNIEKNNENKPILLLDDVFSELDGLRRKKLTAFLKKYQSFITTTDADVIQSNIKASKMITTTQD